MWTADNQTSNEKKFLGGHAPRSPYILLTVCRLWLQHLDIACYGPALYNYLHFSHNMLHLYPLFLYCIFHMPADTEPEESEVTLSTDQGLQLHDEGT